MKKTILILIVLFLAGCDYLPYNDVEYVVSGNGMASVTYSTENGSTAQNMSVSLPWTYSAKFYYNAFLYVSAQLESGNMITAKIYVNGLLYKDATSYGLYSIAAVSGRHDLD